MGINFEHVLSCMVESKPEDSFHILLRGVCNRLNGVLNFSRGTIHHSVTYNISQDGVSICLLTFLENADGYISVSIDLTQSNGALLESVMVDVNKLKEAGVTNPSEVVHTLKAWFPSIDFKVEG